MFTSYRRRAIDILLDELFPEIPALLLDGARAVGKTETAKQRARTIFRFDDDGQATIARADPFNFLRGVPPILIDEWQHVPKIWDAVRRSVDEDRSGARFILTGSAPYSEANLHSGAGRISVLRMRPMTLPERGASTPTVSLRDLLRTSNLEIGGTTEMVIPDYVDEILATGFPGFRGLSPRNVQSELSAYVSNIVERDLEEAGFRVRRPQLLRRWLTAYAASTATTTTWEKIRLAAALPDQRPPSRNTTLPYVETLSAVRVLDQLPAWQPEGSLLSQIGRAAKHQLVDPGLAAHLLGLGKDALLAGRRSEDLGRPHSTHLGALFESLAALTIRTFAPISDGEVFHMRTLDGRREIDVIVQLPDRRVAAFEIKLGTTADEDDVKHLHWLSERIGERLAAAAVINTGTQAYRRPDGIAVIPLALLGP